VNLKLEVTFASGKRSFLAISNENVDLEKWAFLEKLLRK
jgi:hypothetical protein